MPARNRHPGRVVLHELGLQEVFSVTPPRLLVTALVLNLLFRALCLRYGLVIAEKWGGPESAGLVWLVSHAGVPWGESVFSCSSSEGGRSLRK